MRPLPLLLRLCLVLPLCGASLPASARLSGPAPEPDDAESEESDGDDAASDDGEEDADAETEAPASPAEQKASRRILGGAVAGSFGFILSMVAFGLLGARSTCELEGDPDCARNMGIAALATGIPGLALMATGATLLGLGIKQRKALRAGSHTALVSPWLDHRGAGAAFTLRF